MTELYDVPEAAAGRAERALDIEEGLLRLRPEIARRADDLVVDVAALLARLVSGVMTLPIFSVIDAIETP